MKWPIGNFLCKVVGTEVRNGKRNDVSWEEPPLALYS